MIFNKKILFHIVMLLLLVYFVFHSIYGNKGIIAYFKINQKLEKALSEIELIRSERLVLEHRAKLLKSGDRDILDEKARHVLGLAAPNEIVFIKNTGKKNTKD